MYTNVIILSVLISFHFSFVSYLHFSLLYVCSSNLTNNDPTKNVELTFRQRVTGLYSQGKEIVHTVRNGIRSVFSDSLKVVKLMRKVNSYEEGFKCTIEEIELLYEFRLEMRRLYPIVFLGVFPFGNCLAVPLAIKYPRKFLSHHFWTENQKLKFSKMDHEQRVNMYLPILSELDNSDAFQRCPKWKNVLSTVHSGGIPTYAELSDCVPLFEGAIAPFSLDSMKSPLQVKLLKMHNVSHLFSKFNRLFQQGTLIHFIDYQIRHCGGPQTLPFWRLRKFCLMRGINAHEMTEEEMQKWLTQWVNFTKNLATENLALILVAPALVTLHHPSNASLLFNPPA